MPAFSWLRHNLLKQRLPGLPQKLSRRCSRRCSETVDTFLQKSVGTVYQYPLCYKVRGRRTYQNLEVLTFLCVSRGEMLMKWRQHGRWTLKVRKPNRESPNTAFFTLLLPLTSVAIIHLRVTSHSNPFCLSEEKSVKENHNLEVVGHSSFCNPTWNISPYQSKVEKRERWWPNVGQILGWFIWYIRTR